MLAYVETSIAAMISAGILECISIIAKILIFDRFVWLFCKFISMRNPLELVLYLVNPYIFNF